MIGYIARDANGSLWLHKDCPKNNSTFGTWTSDEFMELRNVYFPEFNTLCYKDEPVKVELIIKKL